MNYSWPGNIRELQNVIERAVILSQSSVLDLEPDLIPALPSAGPPSITDRTSESVNPVDSALAPSPTLEEVERGHIVAVLNQTRGVVEGTRGAARILGLHPNTLRHRMQKLGLKRTTYRES